MRPVSLSAPGPGIEKKGIKVGTRPPGWLEAVGSSVIKAGPGARSRRCIGCSGAVRTLGLVLGPWLPFAKCAIVSFF